MLLLKRRVGESIVVGESVRLSIVEIRGGSVRIAIDAPGDLPVYRAELLEKISEENARALATEVQGDRKMANPQIEFPHSIPGMGGQKTFVLYDLDDDHRALVARDEPGLCLLLVDPLRVDPNYPIQELAARFPFDDDQVVVAAVEHRPLDGSMPTVNLAAPIVVGVKSMRGVQMLIDDGNQPLRAPLFKNEKELRAHS
ncbi:MAG: carbon storage regulator [Polyangiales bacterium]